MKVMEIGVWIWGGVTVALAAGAVFVVVGSGVFLEPAGASYQFEASAPHWLKGMFYALKENGSLVAGILGFSGLAWTNFFKVVNDVHN